MPFGANIIPRHQECYKLLSALREKRFYTSPGDTLPPPTTSEPQTYLSHPHTRARKLTHATQSSYGRAEIWKNVIKKCVRLEKCGAHKRKGEHPQSRGSNLFAGEEALTSQIPQVAYLQVSGFAPFIPQWSPKTSTLCVVYAAARE